MDDCETYNCSSSPKVLKDNNKTSPSYSAIYDNEEFYPEEEQEENIENHYHNDPNYDPDDDNNKEYYEEVNCMDPEEEQKNLEKTIFHKAMIGIGPYLVQKARSVLDETSSSRHQQLDVVNEEEDGQDDNWAMDQRKNTYGPHNNNNNNKKKHSPSTTMDHNNNRNRRHSHSHVPIANSRSQSFTKGIQKLRSSASRTQTRQVRPGSRGSVHHFKFNNNNRANKKSSSTSSLGVVVGVGSKKQEQSPLKCSQHYDNSIGQRVASARRMQIKELKSRVTLLENLLKESRQENRTLTRMQHRHEIALSKYEGTEAELPKMIRSHVAEVRSLQENLRKAHNQNRVSDEKLKVRDQKIFRLEDDNKSLMTLVKQNNLEERSKLSEQLEQARVDHKTVEMKVTDLQRHIEILEKNHRHQISVETKKLKTTNNKLFEAHQEIDKLVMTLKEKDRTLTCMRIRQGQIPGSTTTPGGGKMRSCEMTRMPIFRDDLSVRSARTLPHKSTRLRPTDNASLSPHCDQDHDLLRRQRSETCGPHNRKPARFSKFSTMNHKAYLYDSNDNAFDSSYEQHEERFQNHHNHYQNFEDNNIDTPLHDPHHGHGGGGSMSLTPTSHRSSPQCRSVHTHSSTQRRVISTDHRSDDNSQFGTSPPTNNNNDNNDEEEEELDEYFNFENVSVEDDTSYRPHKSLFMDALDSSCNVSSLGQSPLDSMRSNQQQQQQQQQQQLPFAASSSCKNLRPSSTGPKFRLPPKKQQQQNQQSGATAVAGVAGKLFSTMKSSLLTRVEPDNSDDNVMISSIQCPSALQSPVSMGICDIELDLGDCCERNNIVSSDGGGPSLKTKGHNGQQGGGGGADAGAGAGDGPQTTSFPTATEPEPGFISQRPSEEQEDENNLRMTKTSKNHSQNPHDGQNQFRSTSSSSSASSPTSRSSSGEDSSGQVAHCDKKSSTVANSNVKTVGKPKSKSEAHLLSSSLLLSPTEASSSSAHQNVPIIEAMFTKWKKNKSNLLEDSSCNSHDKNQSSTDSTTTTTTTTISPNQQQQPQEQVTPRRKEALLQKIKEIDARNKTQMKKTDEKVSLSNPAYFSKVSEDKNYDSRRHVDLLDNKPLSQLFKPSLYQPFFNKTTSSSSSSSSDQKPFAAATMEIIIPVEAADNKIPSKVKTNAVLPWLNSTTTTTTTTSETTSADNNKKNKSQDGTGSENSEGERSGLRIQHSSILEPRHTLPVFVTSSSPKTSPRRSSMDSAAPLDITMTPCGSDFGSQDIPRKKFSIGTISSLQDGQGLVTVQSNSNSNSASLTCTKNKTANVGVGGRSKQWK